MALWTKFNIAIFACCAIYCIAVTNAQDSGLLGKIESEVKGITIDDKPDPKIISDISGVFKDTKVFGKEGTQVVTDILDGERKALEDALKTTKRSNGNEKRLHGIISIITPLIFLFHFVDIN